MKYLRFADPTHETPEQDLLFSVDDVCGYPRHSRSQPFVYRVRAVGHRQCEERIVGPRHLPRPMNLLRFWQPRAMCRQEAELVTLPSHGQPIQNQN